MKSTSWSDVGCLHWRYVNSVRVLRGRGKVPLGVGFGLGMRITSRRSHRPGLGPRNAAWIETISASSCFESSTISTVYGCFQSASSFVDESNVFSRLDSAVVLSGQDVPFDRRLVIGWCGSLWYHAYYFPPLIHFPIAGRRIVSWPINTVDNCECVQQLTPHSLPSPLATMFTEQLLFPAAVEYAPLRPVKSTDRPRGPDGRFVRRGVPNWVAANECRKICGWCQTTSTTQ